MSHQPENQNWNTAVEIVGRDFLKLRRDLGLDQYEMANRLEMNVGKVLSIERNQSTHISAAHYRNICTLSREAAHWQLEGP
jgi:transcriptional regulator with XRE-family HTH domain